ncbi:MAG: HEAT repeat domain-containing protein [Phycisphaeraceae bacterium]
MLTKHLSGFVLALTVAGAGLVTTGCKSDPASEKNWLGQLVEPLSPPTPGEAARDALNPDDPDRRQRGLARIAASDFGGEEPYVKMYRMLLTDPDPTVRATAARALGMHGSVADAGRIVPLLEDDAGYVRWEAAKALQRIHNPDTVGPLVEAVQNDEDGDVRMAVAEALGQYPRSDVFQALVGALTDTNYGVVQAANRSLATLTGQDLPPRPGAWLDWAEASGSGLFARQKTYTYRPYHEPPGFFKKKLQFWRDFERPAPETPAGLGSTETTGSQG